MELRKNNGSTEERGMGNGDGEKMAGSGLDLMLIITMHCRYHHRH